MNNEFILSPQSFINNTVAPDYAARSRHDTKAFQTASSSAKHADNKESFAAFMSDLKARNAQNNKDTQSSSSDSASSERSEALAKNNADKTAFLTRISKQSTSESIDLISAEETTDDTLSNIELKMAQILDALEKAKLELSQNEPKDKADGDTIVAENTETASDAAKIKILALLVNLAEGGKPLEISATGEANPKDLLTQVMDKLRDMIAAEKEMLITTNKTPEQLAEIQKIVEDILKAEFDDKNSEMLEKLAAQWSALTLIPEQPKQQTPVAFQEKQILSSAKPENAENPALQPAQESDAKARYEDRYKIDGTSKNAQNDNSLPAEQGRSANIKSEGMHNAAANAKAEPQTKAMGEQFLQTLNDSVLAPPMMTAQGSLVYSDSNGAVLATTQSPTQAAMTNISAQAPHASQSHPATQTIIATINKAVKTGETSEIKVQLDPPELGRVEVKMSIDKNNITKVVLTSEKAETHTMLQRDAHILERVLQDTGLYNNDGGISFELASDFNQNTPSGEQRDNSANGRSQAESEDILETTMDWEVDPRTGVMHYNILA